MRCFIGIFCSVAFKVSNGLFYSLSLLRAHTKSMYSVGSMANWLSAVNVSSTPVR